MLHRSFEILKTRRIGKHNTTYQAMKLTDVEDDSKKSIRTTAHVEEMAAAMLVTLFSSPPKEKESFFVDDCCIYTKRQGQIFTIQKWHFDLTRLESVEIIWIEDIGLFSRRVLSYTPQFFLVQIRIDFYRGTWGQKRVSSLNNL